ncbi:hypothetical protein LR48_Vigan01g202600 [Vigna angularis]|uniref:PB1-like domain-containing protein n=1 Tax=Phaseolus angularis TaxID=3914 RepID=A0A0L9TPK5_PHAAN|nr:hypothetical protein LR48_Vigan01g202600 [Vigna angularis]
MACLEFKHDIMRECIGSLSKVFSGEDTDFIRALEVRDWSLDVKGEVVVGVREVVGVEFTGRSRILLIVLCVMNDIEVVIHHAGKFVNDGCLKYEGESETMYFDPDLWSYFVVVNVVKSLGYNGFKDLWFSVGCGPVLDGRLEALCDDVGAMHMVNLAHLNGQVQLYVVHTISQPDVIDMIEYNVDEGGEEVAPQVNEGGEGAEFAEGINDGLRQQLDEGVGGDGETIEAEDVGQGEMTQVAEDEGEMIEVDEGDVV